MKVQCDTLETDPEVIEFAKTHGIEQEIEHIGSVACGYRR